MARRLRSRPAYRRARRERWCTAASGWSPTAGGRSAGSLRSATGMSRTMRFRLTSSATAYETSRLASAGHG